ncbi:hypothetical protein ONE63_010315 [Megalurothrips usitatus]|uniref:RNA-directed DNA polymerase n=1 Tax=Megalurothrips usitatus TaxID=439358 RepID=A0AAV7XHF2_9NEOP|nr:hypothetical protein ONE63_010315 [Megalurothrips usitatus]
MADAAPKPLRPGDDLEAQWKRFKWEFAGHVEFDTHRSRWSLQMKAKYLVQCIGLECDYLHEGASAATKADPELLMGYIDDKIKPTLNACFERYLFKQIVRKPQEDIDQFVSRCRSKLENCGLEEGEHVNNNIIDTLVHNLEDLTLQQLLFRTPQAELTLSKTEQGNQGQDPSPQVHQERGTRPSGRTRPDHQRQHAEDTQIASYDVEFKMDTGAEVNVMPKRVLDRIYNGSYVLQPTDIVLEVYGGTLLRPIGTITISDCTLNDRSLSLQFVVADVESVPLLGLPSCEEYGLITRSSFKTKVRPKRIYQVSLCVAHNPPILYNVNVSECSVPPRVSPAKRKVTFASPLVTNLGDLSKAHGKVFSDVKSVISCYPNVFTNSPGKFPFKYHLDIDPNIKAVATPSRRVPHKLKDRYKNYLDQLCKDNIIKKCDNPVGWVSPVVLLEKPDQSLRVCLDPKHLNKALSRPFFEIPSVEDINASLCNKRYFTVLDFASGFWHCELDSQSSKVCQFSTPYGVFQFKRLPFGLSASPEIFQKAVSDIFGDIDGVLTFFDDVILSAKTSDEHDVLFRKVIERAEQYNVHFKPAKLQYKQNSVKFMGNIYSEQGRLPDPARLEAIKNLQNPNNVKELQRFLGIDNFVREFVPNLADDTNFLRQLLRKNVEWLWLPAHSEAVDRVKTKICNATALSNFDPSLPATIQCDASQYGLGVCLLQTKPVAFASRGLTQCEQNYAQVEKELLAIVYSCQKFHHYIYGNPKIVILTDHKPLVSIFKQPISTINSKRITRLVLKTLAYNLDVQYLPGKYMYVADALSRDFLKCHPDEEVLMYQVHSVTVNTVFSRDQVYVVSTKNDPLLQEVMKFVKTSWPKTSNKLSVKAKKIFHCRSDLTVANNLLYFKNRLVVPSELQNQVLHLLHEGHQGMVRSKALASQTVFWPGISKDIEDFVSQCHVCNRHAPLQRKTEIVLREIPELPYEVIACDILDFKSQPYLIVIDSYSKWLDVVKISDKTAQSVVTVLESLFAIHGIPRIVLADNMPFLSHRCQTFSEEFGFKFVTCSPHYHQSNGLAEKACDVARKSKCQDDTEANLQKCLLHYRTTPIPDLNASPSQLLMSRRLRTKLPIRSSVLKPFVVPDVHSKLCLKQKKMQQNYNKSAKRKDVSYDVGDYVYVLNVLTNVWEPGIIMQICKEPRSYIVQTTGSALRRNSSMIKPRKNDDPVMSHEACLAYNAVFSHQPPNVPPQDQERPLRRSNRTIRSPQRLNL